MKVLFCFGLILALILPLYNVQRKELFEIDGISNVYLVQNIDGEQKYVEKDSDAISRADLAVSEGVVLIFDCNNIDEISDKLELKIVKEEIVDGMQIIYGYTSLYSDFIYIDGKQANVQLVQKQNEIIAGFPIILSGF